MSFSVSAAGSSPLNYQWHHNGTNIPGATRSSYPIQTAKAADGGPYNVGVANTCHSITSADAILDLLPSIASQPQDVITNAGCNVTFSVSAAGFPAPRYQWRFNNTNPIAGATNSSCTITNVQQANQGSYTVVVTNNAGSITSSVASLQVDTNTTVQLLNPGHTTSSFWFRVTGPVGIYVIEASADLANWPPLATNYTPGLWWDYTNSDSAPPQGRYFRALLK